MMTRSARVSGPRVSGEKRLEVLVWVVGPVGVGVGMAECTWRFGGANNGSMASHKTLGFFLIVFGTCMLIGMLGFGVYWLTNAPGWMKVMGVVLLGGATIPALFIYGGVKFVRLSPAELQELADHDKPNKTGPQYIAACSYCSAPMTAEDRTCPTCGAASTVPRGGASAVASS